VCDANDDDGPATALDTNAFIERNWSHLDHGWVDLGARQLPDKAQQEQRKDAEDAATLLVGELVSQFNTAVVSAAYYGKIWARVEARAKDSSAIPVAIDAEGELLGIFARSYVFALDGVEGCAHKFAKTGETPDAARETAEALQLELRWVREVRDSLSHIEERVQGLQHGRRIPTSIHVFGGHSDRGYSATAANGTLVTIEISEMLLSGVRARINQVVGALTWRRAGPVCPACGGSISVEVIGLQAAAPSAFPAVEWHCGQCGFRQRLDTPK
jgi:hypothetical protein